MKQQSHIEQQEVMLGLLNRNAALITERRRLIRLVEKLRVGVRGTLGQNSQISESNAALERAIRDVNDGKELTLPPHVHAMMTKRWAAGECETNLAEVLACAESTVPRCERMQQDLEAFHQSQERDYNLGHFGVSDLAMVTKVFHRMEHVLSMHPSASSSEPGSSTSAQTSVPQRSSRGYRAPLLGRTDFNAFVELVKGIQPTDEDFNRKCMVATDFAEEIVSALDQQDRRTFRASEAFSTPAHPGSSSSLFEAPRRHEFSTPTVFHASAEQRTVHPSLSAAPRSAQHSERPVTSLTASACLLGEAYNQHEPWQHSVTTRQDNDRMAADLADLISSVALPRHSSYPPQPQQRQRGWPASAGIRAPLQPGLMVRSPQTPSAVDHVDPWALASTIMPRFNISDGYTLFAQNIPARFTQADLLRLWPAENSYNLLVLPLSHEQQKWQGTALISDSGAKKLDASAAKAQGQSNNLELMRKSKNILRIKTFRYMPTIIEKTEL